MSVYRAIGPAFADLDLQYEATTEVYVSAGAPEVTSDWSHADGDWGGGYSIALASGDELHVLIASANDYHVAFAMKLDAGILEIRLRDDAHSGTQAAVVFTGSSGRIEIFRGDSSGVSLGSVQPGFDAGTEYWVDIVADCRNVGSVLVYLGGVLALTTGSVDAQALAFVGFDSVRFRGGTGCDAKLADIVVADQGELILGEDLYETVLIPAEFSVPPDEGDAIAFSVSQREDYATVGGTPDDVVFARTGTLALTTGSDDVVLARVTSGAVDADGAYLVAQAYTAFQVPQPTDPDPDGTVPWTPETLMAATVGVEFTSTAGFLAFLGVAVLSTGGTPLVPPDPDTDGPRVPARRGAVVGVGKVTVPTGVATRVQIPEKARGLVCRMEDPVRWSVASTASGAPSGTPIDEGGTFEVRGQISLSEFYAYQASGSSVDLHWFFVHPNVR